MSIPCLKLRPLLRIRNPGHMTAEEFHHVAYWIDQELERWLSTWMELIDRRSVQTDYGFEVRRSYQGSQNGSFYLSIRTKYNNQEKVISVNLTSRGIDSDDHYRNLIQKHVDLLDEETGGETEIEFLPIRDIVELDDPEDLFEFFEDEGIVRSPDGEEHLLSDRAFFTFKSLHGHGLSVIPTRALKDGIEDAGFSRSGRISDVFGGKDAERLWRNWMDHGNGSGHYRLKVP